MSSRSSRELDDDLLLRIFSMVGCARELARYAPVCKRWRRLTCSVDHLVFKFVAASDEEVRTQEGIVSTVLCRASIRAPGSLKHLKVSFTMPQNSEVTGHWLLWTTSLTKLELVINTVSRGWGPAVWNSIVRMKTLEELTIAGNFSTEQHLILPQVLATGLQMARLQKCQISCNIDMIETIFATCPALTQLRAVSVDGPADQALRVASNSLKTFNLFLLDGFDRFKATIHAPSLTSFELLNSGSSSSIHFESAQSLRTLSVDCPYKLYNPPENLQELKLSGACYLHRLSKELMLTPMITDLYFDEVEIADKRRINVDQILSPFINLRNIYVCYDGLLSNLRAGERRFEALNVHIWPCSSAPEVCLLKALIEVHKIQSLVVHCTHMVDYRSKTVGDGYDDWSRFLFEVSFFYPNSVKFVN